MAEDVSPPAATKATSANNNATHTANVRGIRTRTSKVSTSGISANARKAATTNGIITGCSHHKAKPTATAVNSDKHTVCTCSSARIGGSAMAGIHESEKILVQPHRVYREPLRPTSAAS